MSSYANNLSLLPNHQNHHPQQSFIPGHLPQTMAPHPQQQAAAAAAALTQQQQATNPSSFVNFSTLLNQKDSRWLQLEVCREFQRNKCSRPDVECKFAHPGPAIEIQSGKVTACYDSIKGRCNRDKPPCKYFHPPQHLKDQLLINGRNHLALKNALMQQVSLTTPALMPSHHTPSMVLGPSLPPAAVCGYSYPIGYLGNAAAASGIPFGYSCDQPSTANVLGIISDSCYGAGVPNNAGGGPGPNNAAAAAAAAATAAAMRLGGANMNNPIRQAAQAQQTAAAIHQASALWNNQNGLHGTRPRSDRVEVCREFRRGFCNRSINECRFAHPLDGVNIGEDGSVIICMDHEKGRCARDPCRYFHRPDHMKTTSSSPSKSTSTTAGGINGTAGNGSIVMNQPIYPHPANLATTSGFQDSVATRTAAAAAAANTAGALNASLLV